ncbi:MAG TPA: ArsB/NhaD family transporter [Candidatus Hydrothermia bacterium]|nr:ArsB/NhaD family transporter [Candidatus Hydrothermia bacterium]MDD5572433.1 ArsB/NhaD family transporter [Candidatus Hydrothermia bacterium]HOL23353.1 ArsB/NhaD family transporter [Candidatus Hydrothermia bacterium]HOP32519.1 ArsB/NhaD family transporter [Candidatus Hydrothermia bacterium]
MGSIPLLIGIFIVTFVLIAVEKWHRMTVTFLSAVLIVVLGYLTPSEALNYIDFNTLGLLLGMMVIVAFFRRTGFFEYIAIKAIKISKGNFITLFFFFFMLTGIVSAFLDNVTTVLIFSPIIILVASMTGISPFPFLIGEIIASNLGGTATLIGDPPNIIIGSAAGLSFNDFLVNLTLPVLFVMVVNVFVLKAMFKNQYNILGHFDVSLVKVNERDAIKDRALLRKVLIVFAFVIIGFILHDVFKLPPSIVALVGAVILLFVTNQNPDEVLNEVEWTTLFFFSGLFVVVGALEKYQIIENVANFLIKFSGSELGLFTIIWALSFICTILMGAVPYTVAIVPVIQSIILKTPGINADALWWLLSLTVCFSGNTTLVSAAANLVAAGISEKTQEKITFKNYLKYGIPVSILNVLLALLYIVIRYIVIK